MPDWKKKNINFISIKPTLATEQIAEQKSVELNKKLTKPDDDDSSADGENGIDSWRSREK